MAGRRKVALVTGADGGVPALHTLSNEFLNGPPPAAVRHGGETRPSKVAIRYIFWARAQGIVMQAVARDLKTPYGTVVGRINRLRNRPTEELYDCGFVVAVHTGENDVWTKYLCRYCLATFKTRMAATDHAFRHLYDDGDNIVPRQRHS